MSSSKENVRFTFPSHKLKKLPAELPHIFAPAPNLSPFPTSDILPENKNVPPLVYSGEYNFSKLVNVEEYVKFIFFLW
jgi:hypothetical protein